MRAFLLIADSNSDILNLHTRFLIDHGYRVETASDGLTCLAKMRECCPDVLILDRDLLWGGVEGVLARIREETEGPPVPVILLTTSALGDRELIAPPVIACLLKPFRMASLLEAVAAAEAWSPNRTACNLT